MLPAAGIAQKDSLRSVVLNPVVVTGTGTYHKADNSPVAVKVISANELKNAQVTSLQEALSKLTSNITTHTNGMGTFVNFNGVSDDYILILENGKRISGDDRWNRISMDNIKRIEILPGAACALYGSDAIAGVINIITDESQSSVEASSRTKVMSKGRFNQDINLDITQGKFSSYTSYNHRQADNWQVNNYQAFSEGEKEVYKLTGRPMSQAFRSENISEKMEWRFSDKFDVYVKANYYDYLTVRDRNASYFTQKATTDKATGEKTYAYSSKAAYTYDMHHTSYNIGAGARWVPNKRTHLYLDVYTDNFRSAFDYWQTAEKGAYDETRKRTRYCNETFKGIFRLNDRNRLSAGAELIQEHINSASDNIESEGSCTCNIFAQDEVKIAGGLEGVAGLRYTSNNSFGSYVTPSVALFYHIAGFRARVSYAGGYRTPSLSQLYATDQAKTSARYTIFNTGLKPEKNSFWNTNVEYANSWMSIGVSVFVNKIRDMINYRTLSQSEIECDAHLKNLHDEGWTTIRQRDNIDEATIKGITAHARFVLPCGFALSGSYTFNDSKAKTRTLNAKTQEYDVTESPVDKSVRNVANVTASWDRAWHNYRLNVNVDGHIQGERYSSTYGYAPEYQQWDFNTTHRFAWRQFVLEAGLGVENVFNRRDTSFWNSNFSTTSPGRSVYVSMTIRIKD